MSKDHIPSDFGRPSGYRSDLEIAETGSKVKSINTSFGSRNHNAYIMRTDKTHEHFYYNPQTQKSGWHGHNYETRNNHPQLNSENAGKKGETNMEKSNSFIQSLKVDQATLERCNEVSKNAAKNANVQSPKSQSVDGGRERGDSGPGSLGRESGYKSGESTSGHEGDSNGHSSNSDGSSGHSSGGEGSSGGHGNSGEGSGGQGAGGGHSSGGQGGSH